MATNYRGEGEVMTFTAPVGGVVSGVPVLIGSLLVLPIESAAAGVSFAGAVGGVWYVPKVAGTAWATEGDSVYYYSAGANVGKFHTVDDADNQLVGIVAETATIVATSGLVRVNPVGLTGTGDLTAKMDKISSPTSGNLISQTAGGNAQDAGLGTANLVTNTTGAAAGAGYLPESAGASKAIRSTPVLTAHLPTMPAVGGAGNLIQTVAANKELSDAGIAVTDVPTMAVAAVGAGNVITSAGMDKTQQDSGVAIADLAVLAAGTVDDILTDDGTGQPQDSGVQIGDVPSMPAVGGVGNLVQTVAADKVLSDASVAVGDVVTQAAAAAMGGSVPTYAGAGKAIQDSARMLTNIPSMPLNGGMGNLVQTVAADKELSDAGLAVANIPTQVAAAAHFGQVIISGGADKTHTPGGTLLADLALLAGGSADEILTDDGAGQPVDSGSFLPLTQVGALATNLAGMVHCLEVDVEAASAVIGIFNANCPWEIRIVDFHALCTAANAGGTAKLNDAFGGGGNDITDAVVMAVQDNLERALTIVNARKNIAVGGSLSVVKNAAGDDGKVYVYFVRT
jgi:predicted RecA/RadA family phage recombinase